MKNIIAIIVALAMPCLILGQANISENYPLNGDKVVELAFEYGDLTVEKYDGSEIQVIGTVAVNGENANEDFKLSSDRSSGKLTVSGDADFSRYNDRTIVIMRDGTKIYKNATKISIEKVEEDESVEKVFHGVDVESKFTIKIPNNVNVNIKTTYGSIRVNDYWQDMNIRSTYGSVDVVFNETPPSPTFTVHSTYSVVDVMIPESVNASLNLKTGYGRIYTDLDFKPDYKSGREGGHYGQDITGKLNGGKGLIALEATYSNLYLRKTLKN